MTCGAAEGSSWNRVPSGHRRCLVVAGSHGAGPWFNPAAVTAARMLAVRRQFHQKIDMIVRPMQRADGCEGWLLIAQQDHARLAFDLCQGWRPLLDFADPPALEAAILHHDDGWQAWDANPGVDPKSGRPRDFLHMQLPDALPIWITSIEEAARHSPLAAYAVSGHFSALLAHSSLAEQPENVQSSQAFLNAEASRRSSALDQWLREAAAGEAASAVPVRTAAAADWALACLQFFDRFSLWLCRSENEEIARWPLPGGDTLQLMPRTPYDIQVEPWLWAVPGMQLSVAGWWIADRTYRDAADVVAGREFQHQLTWSLRPKEKE